MSLKATSIAALLLGCAIALPIGAANAQMNIPASETMEHENDIAALTALSARPGPIGVAAKNLIALYKPHMQAEDEFILPPLTLLPALAEGKASPDMRWAIAMADRLKAEQDRVQDMHGKLTEGFVALKQAAQAEHDPRVEGFATDLAADDLADVEVTQPTVLLIGEWLRAKLPPQ